MKKFIFGKTAIVLMITLAVSSIGACSISSGTSDEDTLVPIERDASSYTDENNVEEQETEVSVEEVAEVDENVVETETQETEPTTEELIAAYKEMDAYTIVDVYDFSKEEIDELFYYEEISDKLFDRIYGLSFKEDCTYPREKLRYVRLLHVDLEGNTHIGELIVNRAIADDIIQIFRELYDNDYPIERMELVDNYDADDALSMEHNNTSSFNFRLVEGTTHLSKHAMGRAIDLNPQYNPYVTKENGETYISPYNGVEYADRSKDFPYKIDKNDLAYKLFIAHGFKWGGVWKSSQDYQHFQKDGD